MKTDKPKEYVAPEVKVVEVIVEKGFAISAIIYNNRLNKVEKHYLDEEQNILPRHRKRTSCKILHTSIVLCISQL